MLQVSAAPPYGNTSESIAGPYNGTFIAGGMGIRKPLSISSPESVWSMSCWFKVTGPAPSQTLIAGTGTGKPVEPRTQLALLNGGVALWSDGTVVLAAAAPVQKPEEWHFLAATSDSHSAHLFLDGQESATGPATALEGDSIALAPPYHGHFAGQIALFTVLPQRLSAAQIHTQFSQRPDYKNIEFEAGSKPWPVQTRAQAGYTAPQDPATLPHSEVSPSPSPAKPVAHAKPYLEPRGPDNWAILGAWRMIAEPELKGAKGETISQASYSSSNWLAATVPGTVLTTYIDRGIYPDPDYGLNNLAIPESLNKQNYWYRTEWNLPPAAANKKLTLTFNGINYAAEVWFNGKPLGAIKGAFIRGVFDVTTLANPNATNVLAVRIAPPPHPGIPQEQSIKAGPGENGGMLCLDGPTFVATEGWDWIPGIRDRNIGIWQDVLLTASHDVQIGDPQVITRLPLPDTTSAGIEIAVPLHNDAKTPVSGLLHATFEGVDLRVAAVAPPGDSVRVLRSPEFPELIVKNPRLWWPNGYGKPELYHLDLSFDTLAGVSDHKAIRFGIREVTYELSAVDDKGILHRIEYSPTAGAGSRIVDVTHEGMLESPQGWVVSLLPEANNSPAIRPAQDDRVAPYLILKVNGVRIAAKGGNWGMDDSRKRVSREHLEPFFRLHREANLNIIRNWVGQNTEDVFYDLADEHGLLVWNDFWDSTQNYNLEPDDSALFLKNAADTIARFRNHPSIVIWCGRNEGVPAPAVNAGLDKLIRDLDGTRYYTPTSNTLNLQLSGPYKYQAPADYFTKYARGFAVELGIPSLPTIDALKAFIPEPDQWPPSDTWAYHDWHASGNGVITPFLNALEEQYGRSDNLDEFEKKAQMMNYVLHRAIFEGFNAHLWAPNSGRMLWMTQPAWPSTMWQILSSDYDTQASFYGVKKASEPVHIQLNLPDLTIAVVNNKQTALSDLSAKASVFGADGQSRGTTEEKISVAAGQEAKGAAVKLPDDSISFVKLELRDSSGALLSDNFYWQASHPEQLRSLNQLSPATVQVTAQRESRQPRIRVELHNGGQLALMNRVTLRHRDGTRVLPAYYSDNYISLLPNETRMVEVEVPQSEISNASEVTLRGWNAKPATVRVQP